MIQAPLAQVAQWLELSEPAQGALAINGVSTDTRTLVPGNLFVALSGPNFDGHDYLGEARKRGAAAAIVARQVEDELPQLVVDDPLVALQALAVHWRDEVDPVVLAITGSAGKTTVKQMLAAICSEAGPTLATEGNLNNEIGVPLTLLRLSPQDRYAVIEMGANHVGEIARLTRIARPDHGLVTMAGRAHLGEFGSVENIIRGKGELYEGLSGTGRTGAQAVINLDSPGADHWIRHCPVHWDGFALQDSPHSQQASWVGRWSGDAVGQRVSISEHGRELLNDLPLPLPGTHNLVNLLAAVALARQAGIPIDLILRGLQAFRPPQGRMSLDRLATDITLIDDSYNANPESMRAAMKFLAGQPGYRLAVLGDMGELGDAGESLHAELGTVADELALDGLVAVGALAAAAVPTAGAVAATACDTLESATAAVQEHIDRARQAGRPVTILLKGSRFMRMERMKTQLQAALASEATATDGDRQKEVR